MQLDIGSTDASSDLIPKGEKVIVKLVDQESRQTRSGGTMLVLTHEIVEGKYKGARISENCNIINSNEVAVNIARKTLKKIARALGIDELKNSDQLLNARKFMLCTIGIDEGTGGYDDKNKIVDWKPVADPNMEIPTQASRRDEPDFPFASQG